MVVLSTTSSADRTKSSTTIRSSGDSDSGSDDSSSNSSSSSVRIVSGPTKSALPNFASSSRRGTRSRCYACSEIRSRKANNEYKAQPSLEVLHDDRWCTVTSIREDESVSGNYFVRCVEVGPEDVSVDLDRIRLTGRRSTTDDCVLFKEGMDICVYACHPRTRVKGWYDAKIEDVHNRPHNTKCQCKIIVRLYSVGANSSGSLTESLGIERIRILQAPNHVDFVEVVQAAIRPGSLKRIWSRDVDSIESKHDRGKDDLESHHHHHRHYHHQDDADPIEISDLEMDEQTIEEEDGPDRNISVRHKRHETLPGKKPKKRNKHGGKNSQEKRRRIRSSGASGKRSETSRKEKRSEERKFDKRQTAREDRTNCHKHKSNRPAHFYTERMLGESLEIEQGYRVNVESYWNKNDMALEPEPTLEERLLAEMVMFFRKEEKAPAPVKRVDGECEEHDYVMNDLEGLICDVCGHIGIPIEKMAPYVPPDERPKQTTNENEFTDNVNNTKANDDPLVDDICFANTGSQRQLRSHQKQAVCLMKKNIVEVKSGCIVAHAAGTGKTFATVYFYARYRQIMAGCRLLILCPKAVQRVWREEFWNSGLETPAWFDARGESNRLEILRSWYRQQGVLVMSFSLFMMMSSKDKFRDYLLNSPELVILDEAHTVRSEGTYLREAVLSMKCKLRILLSGTLFQNSFGELFNLIYLARPDFMGQRNTEDLARKWFMEKIGNRFQGGEQERQSAQQKLLHMTKDFIDHYNGDILKAELKGLHDYEITTTITDLQHKCLSVYNASGSVEVAHIRTKILLHPLLGTMEDNFSRVTDIDIKASMKTAFVMKLIRLCQATREKVLVFGEYLPPFRLLMRMMELEYNWCLGREVVYLHGTVRADDRHNSIDTFNAEGSTAVVCLASIKACAEGITLTGASRVVLLNPVWNPAVTNQAISRAYRLGQTRTVFVYRLVTEEEKNKNCRTKWKDFCSDVVSRRTPQKQGPQKVLGTEEIFGEDQVLAAIHEDGIIEQVCHRDHAWEE